MHTYVQIYIPRIPLSTWHPLAGYMYCIFSSSTPLVIVTLRDSKRWSFSTLAELGFLLLFFFFAIAGVERISHFLSTHTLAQRHAHTTLGGRARVCMCVCLCVCVSMYFGWFHSHRIRFAACWRCCSFFLVNVKPVTRRMSNVMTQHVGNVMCTSSWHTCNSDLRFGNHFFSS